MADTTINVKDLRAELERMMRGHMSEVLLVMEERLASVASQGASSEDLGEGRKSIGNAPLSKELEEELLFQADPMNDAGLGDDGGTGYSRLLDGGDQAAVVLSSRGPASARDIVPGRPVYKRVSTVEFPADPDEDEEVKYELQRLNYSTIFVVMISAVADIFEIDWQTRKNSDKFPEWYRVIHVCLCLAFVAELIERVRLKGWKFWTTFLRWHYFQLILVVVQVLETLLILREWWQGSPFPVAADLRQFFRLASVLRIVRLFNLLDQLDFATELHLLLTSMHGSLYSLCWTGLFILVPMFVFGMALTELVVEYRLTTDLHEDELANLVHYYGTLDRSMMSLFWSITGGLSYSDAMLPLRHHEFFLCMLGFVVYVSAMFFSVLNIVTGVFVNSATAAATSERERRILTTLQKIFRDVDYDGSGNLTYSEFKALLRHKSIGVCLQSLDIRPSQANLLFRLIDSNGSGVVEIDEFMKGVDKLQGNMKAIDFATFVVDFESLRSELQDFMRQQEKPK